MPYKEANLQPLSVTDFWFNNIQDIDSWKPERPWDFEEWIGVTVGNDKGGTDFQVHVCTPTSIKRIDDKRFFFLIDEYTGVDDLAEALNQFISKINEEPTSNPIDVLATHWAWEYSPIKSSAEKN